MKYRADIDGLRAVAVIPVLLYHAGLGMPGGFVGVDVFFVISGYLITHLIIAEIAQGQFSILSFYERRARRLFPALFAMMAATILAAYFIMLPFDLEDLGKSIVATTFFAGNIWFYMEQGYFNEAAELQPLLHTWSLGVEEQYYVVFPILLVILNWVFKFQRLFLFIGLFALVSFVASILALRNAPEAAFYLPHLRAWELLIGSLLGLAVWRGWVAKIPISGISLHLVSLLGLALIIWPIISYSPETPFPGLSALPPCLGTAILIGSGHIGGSITARLLSLRPTVFIGQLSYSLYLWHWPIISLGFYVTGGLSLLQGIGCLIATGFLAYLSWRFIELPVRRNKRIGQSTIFAASFGLMAMTVMVGLMFWRTEGLPGRFDPAFLALADSQNFAHDRRECHFVTAKRAREGDVCLRGFEGAVASFVLIGDSHADAFSPALFDAASHLRLAGYQYTDGDFRPLPGVKMRHAKEDTRIEDLIKFLEARPSIKTLIYTGFWQHQFTGNSYRHSGDVWVDENYDGSGSNYNRAATINGLTRLAARLPNHEIILLDDVPTGQSLDARAQLRLRRFNIWQTAGLPYEQYQKQRNQYEPYLLEAAQKADNLHYHSIFHNICDADICPLFEDSVLLFRDGDHLSWKGALKLSSSVQAFLASLQ